MQRVRNCADIILNGPNLNMLGVRQPEVYGHDTLADIEAMCTERATSLDLEIDFRQSNQEGILVDWIQEARAMPTGLLSMRALHAHIGGNP